MHDFLDMSCWVVSVACGLFFFVVVFSMFHFLFWLFLKYLCSNMFYDILFAFMYLKCMWVHFVYVWLCSVSSPKPVMGATLFELHFFFGFHFFYFVIALSLYMFFVCFLFFLAVGRSWTEGASHVWWRGVLGVVSITPRWGEAMPRTAHLVCRATIHFFFFYFAYILNVFVLFLI